MTLDNGQSTLLVQFLAALIGDTDDMKPERIGFEAARFLEWIQRTKFKARAMILPSLADLVELFQIVHGLFQAVGRSGTSGGVTTVSVVLPDTKTASDDGVPV